MNVEGVGRVRGGTAPFETSSASCVCVCVWEGACFLKTYTQLENDGGWKEFHAYLLYNEQKLFYLLSATASGI